MSSNQDLFRRPSPTRPSQQPSSVRPSGGRKEGTVKGSTSNTTTAQLSPVTSSKSDFASPPSPTKPSKLSPKSQALLKDKEEAKKTRQKSLMVKLKKDLEVARLEDQDEEVRLQ